MKEYTEEQKCEFMEAYKGKYRRSLTITIAVCVVILPLFILLNSIMIYPVGAFLLIFFVLMIPCVLYTIVDWRCPACDASLGKAWNPVFCSRCGIQLHDDVDNLENETNYNANEIIYNTPEAQREAILWGYENTPSPAQKVLLEQEFRVQVREYFQRVEVQLVEALRALIQDHYPPELHTLTFEIFIDSFNTGFPVRAFFKDHANCEHPVYIEGSDSGPTPANPELLSIDGLYPEELNKSFWERDPEMNIWEIAASEFIVWFVECWELAGGNKFHIVAVVAIHDSSEEFNLKTRVWQPRASAFKNIIR